MTPLEELEIKSRLWHIQHACELLQRAAAEHSFEEYEADELLWGGIQHQFVIIGEALRKLSEVSPETASRITDAAEIIGFRNQLVHNYPPIEMSVVCASFTKRYRLCSVKSEPC